jgi:hypothetical protein
MTFVAFLLGLSLGISLGISDTRTRMLRKLTGFLESRGIRLLDRDGAEAPLPDLIAAVRKR